MGALLAYNIKVTFCITLFFLLYKFFLSKNTFHRSNRLMLLFIYVISLSVPLITIDFSTSNVSGIISSYESLFLEKTPAPSTLASTVTLPLIEHNADSVIPATTSYRIKMLDINKSI